MIDYINDATPLRDLKQYVKERAADGVHCPCCEKKVHVAKYTLNRHQLAMLFNMHRAKGCDWCQMHTEFAHPIRLTQYTTPKHFHVIETCGSDDPAKPDSGAWRITRLGEQFLLGETEVADHVFVLNDEVIQTSEETVNVRQVWERPSRFDIRNVLDTSTFNLIESTINNVLCIPPKRPASITQIVTKSLDLSSLSPDAIEAWLLE